MKNGTLSPYYSCIKETGSSTSNLTFNEYYQQGVAYFENFCPEEAVIAFQKAQKMLAPEQFSAELYYYLGRSHLRLKNYNESLTYLERIVEKQPDYPTIMEKIGQVYFISGNYKMAAEFCQKAIKQEEALANPVNALYYNMANSLLNHIIAKGINILVINKYIIFYYEKALENDIFFNKYSNIIYYDNDHNELPALKLIADTVNHNIAEILVMKAKVNTQMNHTKQVRQDYDYALKFDPNCLEALKFQADNLLEDKEFEKALEIYNKIIEIDDKNLYALLDKAEILMNLERGEELRELYIEKIAMINSVDVSFLLSKIYLLIAIEELIKELEDNELENIEYVESIEEDERSLDGSKDLTSECSKISDEGEESLEISEDFSLENWEEYEINEYFEQIIEIFNQIPKTANITLKQIFENIFEDELIKSKWAIPLQIYCTNMEKSADLSFKHYDEEYKNVLKLTGASAMENSDS